MNTDSWIDSTLAAELARHAQGNLAPTNYGRGVASSGIERPVRITLRGWIVVFVLAASLVAFLAVAGVRNWDARAAWCRANPQSESLDCSIVETF